MANTITLKIISDFEQAARDLKAFSGFTESEVKRIQKYAESFKTEQVDKFISAQERNRIALTATRGETAALQIEYNNIQKKIENLINKGLSPQDAALKPLINKYSELGEKIAKTKNETEALKIKTEESARALEDFSRKSVEFAKNSLLALGAAAVAAATLATKSAIDIAKRGDDYQTFADQIGISIEAYQELSYAAELQDVSQNNLTEGLKNLNKSIGEAQNLQGKLYSKLKESNPELLKQLVVAKDTEQAFNLAVKALGATDDAFEKAALAQALFAGSGKEMLTISSGGVEQINKLRKEANLYGIITENNAKNAGLWDESQKRLNAAIEGTKIRLFAGLIPGITEANKALTNFLSDEEAVNNALNIAKYALIGVTAGLTAFLIVAKGAAIVEFLAKTFKTLTAAIAANPIGAIAVVMSTILVPTILALNEAFPIFVSESEKLNKKHEELSKNTDNLKKSVLEYKKANEELETATKTLNDEEKKTLETRVKLAGLQIEADLAKTVKTLQQTRDAENQRIDTIGKLQNKLKILTNEEKELRKEQSRLNQIGFSVADPGAIARVNMALDSNVKSQQKANDELSKANLEVEKSRQGRKETIDFLANSVNLNIITIDKIKLYNEQIAKQVELRAIQLTIAERNKKSIEGESDATAELTEEQKKLLKQIDEDLKNKDKQITLTEKLSSLNNKEAVLQQENLKTFKEFLKQRIEQEQITGIDRIKFIESEYNRIKALDKISSEEKIIALKAVSETAKELYEQEFESAKNSHDKVKKSYEDHIKDEEDKLKESLNKRIDLFNSYAESINSLFSSIASAFIAVNDAELEKVRQKYSALTQSEIEYQDFLKQQKDLEVQKNYDTLSKLKDDLKNAVDEETKIKTQQQITELENTITANDLQIKAEKARAIQNEKMAKEERKIKHDNAIAARIAANAEIVFSTAEAITKAYSINPAGFGLPWSAFYLSEGIAKAIAVNSAEIPPLQTGTPFEGFDVPNLKTSTKADSVTMKVSSGESVSVRPRGESAGNTEININVNEDNIFKIMNKGIISGKVHLNSQNISTRRVG